MKKLIGIMLAFVAAVTFFVSCSAKKDGTADVDTQPSEEMGGYDLENNDDIVGHGYCGENAMWKLNKDGTLTISGSGEIKDYIFTEVHAEFRPWEDYVINKDRGEGAAYISAKKLVIEEGITTIGENAFASLRIRSVLLPDSLERIKSGAFANCYGLVEIRIPANVSEIASDAFEECENMETIVVDYENQHFEVDEKGVLFDKVEKREIFHPVKAEDEYVSVPCKLKYEEFETTAFYVEGVNMDVSMPDSYTGEGKRTITVFCKFGDVNLKMGDGCEKIDICRVTDSVNYDNFFEVAYGGEFGPFVYDYSLNSMYDDGLQSVLLDCGNWLVCVNWAGDLYLFEINVFERGQF